jgi:lipopolysaccharide transport system ATP-binding protein
MNKNTAIKVEGLSKKYLLNKNRTSKNDTLYGSFINGIKNLKQTIQKKETEEFWALKDISFDINQGDRVGIIGRNGAGKSTLLKILSRITPPSSGRIEYTGRMASLLEVGTGFHGDLSGRENIYLNGSILGMHKHEIDKKFDEIVAFSEVEQFLDTPVKRYSSGMYVRLAFAVAAHLEPEILIVDEVLAVGDAAFQKKCLGKMEDVSTKEGRTILFVSHSMQAVQKLCNKGILLQKGQLMLNGGIDQVVDLYLQLGSEINKSVFSLAVPIELTYGAAYQLIVEDMNGKELEEIPVGKSWQVRIKFKIEKTTPHFIIALGIVSSLDYAIRTTWSEPEDLEVGDYEVVFENCDILLTTGIYRLVVGLSSNVRTFHYSDNEVSICISDAGDIVKNKSIINTQSGLILNPMKLKINKFK